MPQPFTLPFSQSALDDLRSRLAHTRWPAPPPGAPWEYGVDPTFLQHICTHWRDAFDWPAQLDRLSAFSHFRYVSHGLGIHYIHERGRGPSPLPIVITHGWPGSFVEMLRLIPLLTNPPDPADSFDVVVPSLPGFAYSDRPTAPGMNAFRIADLWADLMTSLGYSRFGAQGGDLGAGVTTALGLNHPKRMLGLHLNYIPGSYRPFCDEGPALTSEESAFLGRSAQWAQDNGAYAHLQSTRPQTPAYALNDSPAGLAAWILEKFRDWSDCAGDPFLRFTADDLLTNVTLYWMTGTIDSSFRIYFENRKAPFQFQRGDYVHPPTAIATFPKEISAPPRSWVERGYNVQRWTAMPHGGHFAAMESPDLLAADLRDFFRPLRP